MMYLLLATPYNIEMEGNKIAAVIVTYNRKELLLENIEALNRQTYKDFDAYIIDNASTDGTWIAIEHLLSDTLFYVNTGSNLGGSSGFKYGIKYALAQNDYDYIWIMDDDTIPEKDALKSLVEKADFLEDDFSFLSSIVKWIDGSSCLMNLQVVNELTTKNLDALLKGLLEVKQASFVSCFINSSVIKIVGLPIAEFFIYGDDVEYTERLRKIKQGYLDVDSVVIHKMRTNINTSLVTCEAERIDRYQYQVRNYVFMAKKYGFKGILKNGLYNLKMLVKILQKSPSYKGKRIKILFVGIGMGLVFNPKIENI